jgi:metal-responsive CopG/Arc/MetJ family transcriptional regulator
MVPHMKTTLEIPDHVMRQLKERAARDRTTMSELVEAALRTFLEEPREAKEIAPLPTWNSGGLLVNIDSRNEWYDALDEDEAGDVRR